MPFHSLAAVSVASAIALGVSNVAAPTVVRPIHTQEKPRVTIIPVVVTDPPTTSTPTLETAPATAATTTPKPTRPPTTTTVMVRRVIQTHTYVRPTNRPVSDPWREPANPYAAGNRGIEFATLRGDTIWIPESGTVTFAGWVAGTYYLVIAHPDGIRTTLGNLQGSRFRAGQVVERGSGAGAAAGRIHFGARVGDRYIDPTPLLGPAPKVPWLTK